MTIDGWECTELYPDHEWRARYAKRGNVEWSADHDGLSVEESSYGYMGGSSVHILPANVAMWLLAGVR